MSDGIMEVNNTLLDYADNTYVPYEKRPETYIVPVVFFLIFVVGVLGNGTLVIIFLRHRAMRNIPNTYIFSLALADLLVIVTCVPFTSILYTLESWPWGVVVCKVSEATKDISIGVSVFTLTALSADRYCAIVKPMRTIQTKPLTVVKAFMIWLLATSFALPDAFFSRLEYVEVDKNKTITFCTPFPNITYAKFYQKYSVLAKSLIYYFVPLVVIGFFYVLMAVRLHNSANEMPGDVKGTQNIAQAKARKHVARMVLIFVFLFFICFLPHHVFMLWFHFNPSSQFDFNDWWHLLRIVGFCLSFLNSCVNPVALYCVSGVFRGHFNRYLCCSRGSGWPRKSAPNKLGTSLNSTIRKSTQDTAVENCSVRKAPIQNNDYNPVQIKNDFLTKSEDSFKIKE